MGQNQSNKGRRGGIIVDSLGMSQLSYELTRSLNSLNRLDEYWDILIFYRNYDKHLATPFFGMMQENEVWGFDAPVISTDLNTTETLIHSLMPTSKFFYVWNLEWKNNILDAEKLHNIYCHKDIKLIARNKYHFDIIKNTWKEPIDIIEDFNYERIIKLFKTAN